MPRRTRSIRQIVRDFLNNSTSHGISHAVGAPNRNWRVFWTTVFVLCVGFLCIQIINIIMEYLAFDKNVSINLKFEKAPYPSVTFCNLNPFKLSLLHNVSGAQTALSGLSAAMAQNSGKFRARREIDPRKMRYRPVYSPCKCLTAENGKDTVGSCLATHKYNDLPQNYKQSRCICDYHIISKATWPCYPEEDWTRHQCHSCTLQGHCAIPYVAQKKKKIKQSEKCLCHDDFNHCIANIHGKIESIEDIEEAIRKEKEAAKTSATTTTTQAPAVQEALGYQGMTDEVAITTKGKENIVFAVAALPADERSELSYTKDEFILQCSFNGQQCDIENDFQLHLDPSYGNCYTFNWNMSNELVSTRAGANYGLRLLLYANASDYLPTSEAVGIRLIAHEKNSVPFPDAFGYSAPTGFLSSFGMRMKKFSRLPSPYGQCLRKENPMVAKYIFKGFAYSVEGCYRSCLQETLMRMCGCGDPRYPTLPGNKTCDTVDPSARECIENSTEYYATAGHELCACPQPCDEDAYDITYSTSQWPSGSAKVGDCEHGDEMCIQRFSINAAMVQVFYEALNYEKFAETPAYPFVNLMADFGGTTGLWLGISIISMIELIVFLYDLVTAWRGDRSDSEEAIQPPSSIESPKPPPGEREPPFGLDTDSSEADSKSFRPWDARNMQCMCDCSLGRMRISPLCPKHKCLINGAAWNQNQFVSVT